MYKNDYIIKDNDMRGRMKELLFDYSESCVGNTIISSWKRKNIHDDIARNSLLILTSAGTMTCFPEQAHLLSKRNEDWRFFLVIRGSGSFRIHNKTFFFSPGNIIVIAPQFVNVTFNISSPFAVVQTFYIANTVGVQHLCIREASEIAVFRPDNFSRLTAVHDDIMQKMENQLHETTTECAVLQSVFAFLYEVERRCFSVKYRDPVSEIYNEINKFPGRPYSIQELAQKSGLSIRTLQRRFKKQTGCSIQNLITICWIGFARVLLQNTFLPVSEIAYRCCFHDVSYFSTTFKQVTGMSANEFRKKNSNTGNYTYTSNLTSSVILKKDGGVKELSPRKKEILWLINEKRNISIRELAKKMQINPSAVQKHIESLKKEKILQRSGPRNGGVWIITRP